MAFEQKAFFRVTTGGAGVADVDRKAEIRLGEKLETSYRIRESDSYVVIPFAHVGNIRLIRFWSNDAFVVIVETTEGVLDFGVRDEFVLSPSEAFTKTLMSLMIGTRDTDGILVHVQILGEVEA